VSTEPIVNPAHSVGVAEPCQNCGAPMATDQRYCLECGNRRAPMSSVLLGGPPRASEPTTAGRLVPETEPPRPVAGPLRANNTLTLIAGVGVLMLAMGVGVLIGRAGAGPKSAAPQVISVGSGGPAATSTTAASESFTGDWPAGTTGYTVQLQSIPQSGTQVSAVQAAKAAASAKGAKNVGALKSDEFSSLPAGSYVIYSGVYHKRPEAEKALKALKKSFPGASVLGVSNGSSGSGSPSSSGSGAGNNLNNPAPPSVLESKPVKGKSYEQIHKNLPNVISTG
jgi:hypothetical protein